MTAEAAVRANAFAKINLLLHVVGARPDGYHELRSVFQSVALHDTLTFTAARGPFLLECDAPGCPVDQTNLVWRAARRVWRAAGRAGEPRGVRVRLRKRIPVQAGLGGGSSDAAAALKALGLMWRVPEPRLRTIAAALGADVPYFFEGGTALGLRRGDLLFPLIDAPRAWAVLVVPPFGVRTAEAFDWFDRSSKLAGVSTGRRAGPRVNDLEGPVGERHPEIPRLVRALRHTGARLAAMAGSGSTVFGLFDARAGAERAASRLAHRGRVIVTRTLTRAAYARESRPHVPA